VSIEEITSRPIRDGENRLLELDVFRGIAALSVLLFHYTWRFNEIYGHAPGAVRVTFGHYGVDLFFMISGFVIFMTLEKTKHGTDFIVSRFSRLFPAYWTAIALTFAIVGVFGLPDREVSITNALANLSMLEEFFRVPFVDGVYWTLSLELSFYAIMFVLYQTRMLARIELVCAAWLIVIAALHALQVHRGVTLPDRLQVLLLTQHGQLFIAGMMLYKIRRDGISVGRGAILAACAFSQWYLYGAEAGIFAVLCFTALFLGIQKYLGWMTTKPLIFLGTISYTLYLLHQNIGYVILRAWHSAGLNSYLGIVVAAIVAISLAAAVTFLIEKPVMRMIRQWYRNRRAASVAVAQEV